VHCGTDGHSYGASCVGRARHAITLKVTIHHSKGYTSCQSTDNGVFIVTGCVTGMTNGIFAKLGCAGCPERAECARQVRTRLAGASGRLTACNDVFLLPSVFRERHDSHRVHGDAESAKASQGSLPLERTERSSKRI
jgi:hypothetical protein